MVDRASARTGEDEAVPQDCAHHWQIETPSGETSQGVCKRCGATRAFANYSSGRTMTRSPKVAQGGSGDRVSL